MKKTPDASVSPASNSLWLRRYLYLTAAVTGGVILIIEILGAKMLAPYLGTSHFVWTAQIAVTLISLATGYYLGGRWADGSAKLDRFYAAIIVAALYLCGAVWFCEPLAYACLRFKLALGALFTSLLMFFPPLTLLAMAGPFLVRALTDSLQRVGRQMGQLTAISTLGSVAGTVLIGYVLIPLLPNSVTMIITAFVLLAVSGLYFLLWRGHTLAGSVAGIGVLIGLGLGFGAIRKEFAPRFGAAVELYRGNSNFGLMQVMQAGSGGNRYYLNDYLYQNTYDPNEKKSISLFTYMLYGLAMAYTPAIHDALCIGLGVGIVPMDLARAGAKVDVAEINPAVAPVAQEFFGLEPNRLNLVFTDGRYYLNRCAKKYDTIILDAFLGDSMPTHLFSREAFQEMSHRLKPQGTLVINSFVSFKPGEDFFGRALDATLRSVFPSVIIHDGGNGNVFFVASPQPALQTLHAPDLQRAHASVQAAVKATFDRVVTLAGNKGLVLTDDYNPVEFYDASNREELRRRLAQGMRYW